MAQPVLLGLLSTIRGRAMTELPGAMVLRKNPLWALLVPLLSSQVLALRNSCTAEPGTERKPGLQSKVPTPGQHIPPGPAQQAPATEQIFTFHSPQNLSSTENSSMLTSAVRSRGASARLSPRAGKDRQGQPVGCKCHLLCWTPRLT